jgi:hypothetical protein
MANNLKKDHCLKDSAGGATGSGVRPRPRPGLHGKGASSKRFSHPAQKGDASWGVQRLP